MRAVEGSSHVVWGSIDPSENSSNSHSSASVHHKQAAHFLDPNIVFTADSSNSSFKAESSQETEGQIFDFQDGRGARRGGAPHLGATPLKEPPVSSSGGAETPRMEEQVTRELIEWMLDETTAQMVWSRGCAKHPNNCAPCHNHQTSHGCARGVDCAQCHMPHTSSGKARPGSFQRSMCKRVADAIQQKLADDPDGMIRAANVLGSTSPYLRRTILERLNREQQQREVAECSSLEHQRLLQRLQVELQREVPAPSRQQQQQQQPPQQPGQSSSRSKQVLSL